MVKSAADVAKKMQDRVSSAGGYLKSGMQSATDPTVALAANADASAAKLSAGVAESVRTGRYQAGIKKAAQNGSWGKSVDRAAAHYQERAADMTANALADYDKRAAVIQAAKDKIKDMPKTTRTQRIARSQAYLNAVSAGMDTLYNRKA